jgi:hypothetical protein
MMLAFLRRALYTLIPIYAYLLVFSVTNVPSFRQLDVQIQQAVMPLHFTAKSVGLSAAENETMRDTMNSTEKVLALLTPPGIIGGYRNQFIRFVSLMKYAKMNHIHKLLLPSLLWSTTHRAAHDELHFYPVPMEFLFDIDHWNSFHDKLPVMVDTVSGESDCWRPLKEPTARQEIQRRITEENKKPKRRKKKRKSNSTYIVSPLTVEVIDRSGYLVPVANETFDYLAGKREIKPRKMNLLPAVEHCQNPQVIGGGKSAGVLWNLWEKMQRARTHELAVGNEELIEWTHQALRPHQRWRNLAHQCVLHNLPFWNRNGGRNYVSNEGFEQPILLPPYLAAHPRVSI